MENQGGIWETIANLFHRRLCDTCRNTYLSWVIGRHVSSMTLCEMTPLLGKTKLEDCEEYMFIENIEKKVSLNN